MTIDLWNGIVSEDIDIVPITELPVNKVGSLESQIELGQLLGLKDLSDTIREELDSIRSER